jgi:tRNA-2-methylthio-N6-dimethylallyladenosine synthase
LFALQSSVQLELNQGLIGRRVEVLVDGPAKRGAGQWQGRGDDNRVVCFPADEHLHTGTLVEVTVTGATPHALIGELAQDRVRSSAA